MEPREAWNRQWRAPLVSTLAGSLDPATLGLIENAWRGFFATLAPESNVLDIGTGNGYLALLALRAGKGFAVHGADAAAINPPSALPARAAELSKIHFHPEMPAEHLRFADETFDAVIGQHALEYGDVGAALGEIFRVLKPKGRVRFLMHSQGSEILKANLPKIAQFHFVLNEAKLFEVAEDSIAAALAGGSDGGARLFAALDQTAERFKGGRNLADLQTLLGLLRGAYERRADFGGPARVAAWLAENRAEAEAALARIEAMEKAALGQKGLEGVKASCAAAGLAHVGLDKLSTRTGSLLGWWLGADKP